MKHPVYEQFKGRLFSTRLHSYLISLYTRSYNILSWIQWKFWLSQIYSVLDQCLIWICRTIDLINSGGCHSSSDFPFPRLVCIDGPPSTNYGYSPGGFFEFCTVHLSASCTVYPNRAEDMPKESNYQTTTSNIHINILFNYRTDQDKDTALFILFTVIQTSFKICVYNPVFVE